MVHRYTCAKAGGTRIGTHDAIARIWLALLAATGWLDIEYEPRRWDAEVDLHRRSGWVKIENFTTVTILVFS